MKSVHQTRFGAISMVDKKQTRLFRIDDKKMVDSYLTAVMKGAE